MIEQLPGRTKVKDLQEMFREIWYASTATIYEAPPVYHPRPPIYRFAIMFPSYSECWNVSFSKIARDHGFRSVYSGGSADTYMCRRTEDGYVQLRFTNDYPDEPYKMVANAVLLSHDFRQDDLPTSR